jgi:hypothetical protein
MRLEILAIVSGIALSLSAAAYASQAQTGASAQPISATNGEQKVICRYMGHEGTVMPRAVCATQYVWEKERRRQQRELADFQLRSYTRQ